MSTLPDIFCGAEVFQGFVGDPYQAALLQVGGRYAPASFQVTVEAVSENVAEGALRIVKGLEAGLRVARVLREGQVQRLENPAC